MCSGLVSLHGVTESWALLNECCTLVQNSWKIWTTSGMMKCTRAHAKTLSHNIVLQQGCSFSKTYGATCFHQHARQLLLHCACIQWSNQTQCKRSDSRRFIFARIRGFKDLGRFLRVFTRGFLRISISVFWRLYCLWPFSPNFDHVGLEVLALQVFWGRRTERCSAARRICLSTLWSNTH